MSVFLCTVEPLRGSSHARCGTHSSSRSVLCSGSLLCSHSAIQIFQPTDNVTEEKALKTMQVLIQTIYSAAPAEQADDAEIEGLAKEACEECIQILREPEKSQAKHAIKVLCAFMSTTRQCSSSCTSFVLLNPSL